MYAPLLCLSGGKRRKRIVVYTCPFEIVVKPFISKTSMTTGYCYWETIKDELSFVKHVEQSFVNIAK